MSHAIVLVALDDIDPAVNLDKNEHIHGVIEDHVEEQMAPFDENNEMFRDGSRWNWWVIGGRWDGVLMGKNIVRRKDLSPAKFLAHSQREHRKWYREMWEERKKGGHGVGGHLDPVCAPGPCASVVYDESAAGEPDIYACAGGPDGGSGDEHNAVGDDGVCGRGGECGNGGRRRDRHLSGVHGGEIAGAERQLGSPTRE
jgi:hypothetical protein